MELTLFHATVPRFVTDEIVQCCACGRRGPSSFAVQEIALDHDYWCRACAETYEQSKLGVEPMPFIDYHFEEILNIMTRAIERDRHSSVDDRRLATLTLKALVDAGFVPIKSINDLMRADIREAS